MPAETPATSGSKALTEYRYNRLTWAEMNEAIAAQKLVILPTASTEQHGRHLPLDVDLLLAETVSLEAAKRSNGNALVYILAFPSLEARQKSWDAFRNDLVERIR